MGLDAYVYPSNIKKNDNLLVFIMVLWALCWVARIVIWLNTNTWVTVQDMTQNLLNLFFLIAHHNLATTCQCLQKAWLPMNLFWILIPQLITSSSSNYNMKKRLASTLLFNQKGIKCFHFFTLIDIKMWKINWGPCPFFENNTWLCQGNWSVMAWF